jgi:hypothetical protein
MNKNTEHVKGIIKRQTDYSDEEINLKMQIHNNDPMAILREYMSGTPLLKKPEENKSVNQTIYSEIRHLMDDASKTYKQKKEMEERNKIIRENLIRNREIAAKKLREKLTVVEEETACETAQEAQSAAANACETAQEAQSAAANACETAQEAQSAAANACETASAAVASAAAQQ